MQGSNRVKLRGFYKDSCFASREVFRVLKIRRKAKKGNAWETFNLGQYGDELSGKLLREISKEKNCRKYLAGQLKGYEDISEAKKIEKEEV